MSKAVIFSSRDQIVFVLDIPTSIEAAEGGGRLCSSVPLETPFVTPEPKGDKRTKFIAALPTEHVAYHIGISNDCERALMTVKGCLDLRPWCLPRVHNVELEDVSLERAVTADDRASSLPVVLSTTQNDFQSTHCVQNQLIHNDNARKAYLQFRENKSMLIPSRCTFSWSSSRRGLWTISEFSASAVHGKPLFDVVLMDPPWANRSVRNTQKYHTAEEQSRDPFEEALTFLNYLRKPNGHAAIWITNKVAVRDQVLTSMAQRGFDLVEEWVWLKVTTKGEPVTPLDGVWRKPYELMLLFRQRSTVITPTRRVIIAVPDMHSRKPNLKQLFETLLGTQQVLELFARNLTSGWWCIGDEVLKFQDTRVWQEHPP